MLASIVAFIIRRTINAAYVPALERTRKDKKKDKQSKKAQRKDQEDNDKLLKESVLLVKLTKLSVTSLLTFIHKMK